MKHSQIARVVISICMLLVGIFSAYSLYKAFRPSAGVSYEVLTMEQAQKYMEFEAGYVLVDVREKDGYDSWHLDEAVSIPYTTLVESAMMYLPDKTQMIYVYGDSDKLSSKACVKLSGLGYVNVAQITGMAGQIRAAQTEPDTEGLAGSASAGSD